MRQGFKKGHELNSEPRNGRAVNTTGVQRKGGGHDSCTSGIQGILGLVHGETCAFQLRE